VRDRIGGQNFPLFEEGADTPKACRGSWKPSIIQSVVRDKRALSNSPRVHFVHVGPLFKEWENDTCTPTKPVTHPKKKRRLVSQKLLAPLDSV
jgi:hypothetical protein